MALLVAVPAAVLTARASGLSQRAALLAATVLIGVSVSAALGLDPGSIAPGHTAQQLIDTGRDSCPTSPGRRVQVPLVGLTWTCPPGASPRASGQLPALPKAKYSATSLQVSADLRQLELTNLELNLPATQERLGLRTAVRHARVRGLPPWGRPAGRSTLSRLFGSVLACVATLALALVVLPRLRLGSLGAAVLGALGGLFPLLATRALDRFGLAASSYWVAAAAGPLGIALIAAGVAGLQRVFRGRSSVARQAR
jgi:hypothetical protein